MKNIIINDSLINAIKQAKMKQKELDKILRFSILTVVCAELSVELSIEFPIEF